MNIPFGRIWAGIGRASSWAWKDASVAAGSVRYGLLGSAVGAAGGAIAGGPDHRMSGALVGGLTGGALSGGLRGAFLSGRLPSSVYRGISTADRGINNMISSMRSNQLELQFPGGPAQSLTSRTRNLWNSAMSTAASGISSVVNRVGDALPTPSAQMNLFG